jgi:2-methylisocitrate lyase-like PEP mutase family enzyme
MSDNVKTFRDLHKGTPMLRLPNAWDAGSAALIARLGATAIASSSAGVAWALGYPDGRVLPVDEAIGAAARIVRVVAVPVTVDIENGYSDDPRTVADNVMRLVDLGVAGINIEDGPDTPTILAAKIDAIRNVVSKAGSDLFINARTDVFLASLVEKPKLVEESVTRANLYGRSGADGIFLPGVSSPADIRAVVASISLPLNVMALPGLADAEALEKLGVRRLSAGSGIAQVLWAKVEELAKGFLETGRSDSLGESSMPYRQLQNLFPKK